MAEMGTSERCIRANYESHSIRSLRGYIRELLTIIDDQRGENLILEEGIRELRDGANQLHDIKQAFKTLREVF